MQEDAVVYAVVVNAEEQYSIWPTFKKIPLGWVEEGTKGTKQDCLQHIKEKWTDMRPLSLRKKMEERQKHWEEQKHVILQESGEVPPISSVVRSLVKGRHAVTAHPACRTSEELEKALVNQYLHITFTDTLGMTCVAVVIVKANMEGANFSAGSGTVFLEGICILDFVRLRCFIDLDISSLNGEGRVEVMEILTPFEKFFFAKDGILLN